MLSAPRLRFSPSLPSQVHLEAYRGLRAFGPFDSSRVVLAENAILFVYPKPVIELARQLAMALRVGYGGFPGFTQMFRVPFENTHIDHLAVDGDMSTPEATASRFREEITRWSSTSHSVEPALAVVVVPHSEQWQTD